MDASAILLAGLRGTHLLALLLLLGTLVGLVALARPAHSGPRMDLARRRLLILARVAAVAALIIGCGWLVMQAITIGAPSDATQALADLWLVVRATRFGQVVVVRLILVALALPLLRRQRGFQVMALALVVVSATLQGVVGHAGAAGGTEGDALVVSEAFHMAAAGAWLGGLPSLFLLVVLLPPREGAVACRRFSPIGIAAVLVLMGTAIAQATALIGGVPQLLGTTYGRIALAKLTLFLVLLVLACANRFALTTRLERTKPDAARRWMLLSLGTETLLGLGVVLAASFLASSVPALHEQPTWPFPWRPSLVAMAEPELRREVVDALITIGVAVAIVALGLFWRWLRWPALAVGAVMLWFAIPHLDLLFVEAYPTSYYSSPTGFSTDSIARGANLFPANCASCHGAAGHGDGPRAAQLPDRPADLTALPLWDHTDGELFWWLTHGMDTPDGGQVMPGFGTTLSDDDRWALIDYIRGHNAGAMMASADAWPVPVRAPSMPIACDGVASDEMGDLRGAVVRVIAGVGPDSPIAAPVPPQNGVRTVVLRLSPDGTATPARGECVAATASAWPAFAILAGVEPGALTGTEFLVDPQGWLRAVQRPDQARAWQNQDQIIAVIRDLLAHPIITQEAGTHAHHH